MVGSLHRQAGDITLQAFIGTFTGIAAKTLIHEIILLRYVNDVYLSITVIVIILTDDLLFFNPFL